LLIASVSRVAVVKSGVLRFKVTYGPLSKLFGTACSTVAPFGIRPLLGMFTVMLEPSLPSTPKPLIRMLPCAIAYTWPLAPRKGVMTRLPPRRLFALPIEDTVTSMVWPGLAKGGRLACTVTAATFCSIGLVLGGTVTPNFASMFSMLWIVNGVWVVWSPVPSSPTTRP
jgi:hypothetical protein